MDASSRVDIDGEWTVDEAGIIRRRNSHDLDAESFERALERIRGGLEWGVGALCERDGSVLLVRQDDQWLLPGGGVEPGETKPEALVRELDEETGLDADVGALRVVTEQTFQHGGDEASFRFAIYEARVEGELTDDPGLEDESITDVSWFERLPDDTLDRALIRFLCER
ncbi:NUDIX hydrolase [Haloferax mediterranei ATCC 33500]|uniref:Mut/nudix family protein n=1 Tax=Haloferax mediterranei (strain ATCC 33500 / DSM 1411 / JCM 8866 / NBRC 14739 / NCIMB 2177 / R-4) TaxID=523841 RepID=I3R8G8_HALMT|nr:NUDIX hydrolase [Haloferax mediterranei]AFK20528.1 Mut/nudix family protein [Haloferax mediterranei ATCC 33500]AHZ23886.1 NUDIX hydrolase [Haloferax mediterranei ATCC 33500]ELZ98310.1 Mut/nudix family protein [Haloferax mediterranei ATCC 33500]MDX5986717.1 NUDIX hydrolase [Haloferax mediterranei ATCC 33500]QCQ76041.1 NUDIX hydrolase [Haloferax mediterranei ATCC 33500]